MSSLKILVVDDDRSNCDLVSRLLAQQGYDCDVALDGEAALELVAETPYALAVLDYQMPGMNGVELFRRVRELQPDLLGVFLTAYPSINTVFPAIDAGVERVLAKPANARELVAVVEDMIGPAEVQSG
jgi:DNA-binding response OmpR family regulator